jgi:glycosyltransferase involved in cell wall biosynthesis
MAIRAFALFLKNKTREQRKNCELLIVGSGPELDLYTQMVKTFDIEKEVKFIGWMDRDELMSVFKTSSAFVFPSHEGAGMVVAEALSFGLPVICLDNCGPGEFIDKEIGFAVSYSDYNQTVVELSEAMQKLAEDKSLLKQMSLKARQRFETHFHWDVRGEEFRKVYLAI